MAGGAKAKKTDRTKSQYEAGKKRKAPAAAPSRSHKKQKTKLTETNLRSQVPSESGELARKPSSNAINKRKTSKTSVSAASGPTKSSIKKGKLPIDGDLDAEDDPTILENEFNTRDVDRQEDFGGSSDTESSEESEEDVLDSDDGPVGGGFWSEDEDDNGEEALNAMNIQGMSRSLDAQKAVEAAEAQAELEEAALQTNIAGDPTVTVGDGDDDDSGLKSQLTPDLQFLRTRITDNIRILGDMANQAQEGRSRYDYREQVLKDICAYYGYSFFLAEKLFNLFSPQEAFTFFEANEIPRPVVIRVNTLHTNKRELSQALINRGVQLRSAGDWNKVGLQILKSNIPLGATPEYLAGEYMLQAAASFLPVIALAPQPAERVLDMAAAPGGKTTYMSALMKNTGTIMANDSNRERHKALHGNIQRLGVKNALVSNIDSREFPKIMAGFDRVLLDAPCSGTGVIAKDESVKTNKTEKDFMRLPHLQKQLLLCAIDSVNHTSKTGGIVVYSTCSVSVEENEQVVQYALNKRPNVKLVETGISIGVEGFVKYQGKTFHPSMKLTRRFYPHVYNVDGFFVSKFQKVGPTPSGAPTTVAEDVTAQEVTLEEVKSNKAPVAGSAAGAMPDELASIQTDDFGGWSTEEDEKFIQRSLKKQIKKKGFDPRAVQKTKERNKDVEDGADGKVGKNQGAGGPNDTPVEAVLSEKNGKKKDAAALLNGTTKNDQEVGSDKANGTISKSEKSAATAGSLKTAGKQAAPENKAQAADPGSQSGPAVRKRPTLNVAVARRMISHDLNKKLPPESKKPNGA